jgi:prepilin-type N-terminal cleavage/methylation domain-containing protein
MKNFIFKKHTKKSAASEHRSLALRGFTLIELVVTIAIMVLMLSLTITNFNGSQQSRNSQLAESTLVSDLHKIQTFSLNSANSTNGLPASSWSVNLDLSTSSYYTLQVTDNSVVPSTATYALTQLPKDVSFSQFQITTSSGVCFNASTLNIIFTVPYGRILMSYTGTPCGGGQQTTVTREANDIANIDFLNNIVYVNGIAGNINSNTSY